MNTLSRTNDAKMQIDTFYIYFKMLYNLNKMIYTTVNYFYIILINVLSLCKWNVMF